MSPVLGIVSIEEVMADEVAENPAADSLGEGGEVLLAEVGLEEDEVSLVVKGKGYRL